MNIKLYLLLSRDYGRTLQIYKALINNKVFSYNRSTVTYFEWLIQDSVFQGKQLCIPLTDHLRCTTSGARLYGLAKICYFKDVLLCIYVTCISISIYI